MIAKGKGRSGYQVEQFQMECPMALLFTLNEDTNCHSNLHFEIHNPRHHQVRARCPVVVTGEPGPGEMRFPAVNGPLGCTLAYMLAVAWLLKAPEVYLPGCDYEMQTERVNELPSVYYWLGKWPIERVHLPHGSRLLREVYC